MTLEHEILGMKDAITQLQRLIRATLSRLDPDIAEEIVTAVGSAFTHDITGPEHLAFPGGATLFLREDATWQTPPGGTPSGSVATEFLFGQVATVGASPDYSRGDHSHGTPPLVHHEVRDEGVDQGDAGTFDFVGAGVTATIAGGVATITIPGGGGSGDEPTVSDWFLS